MEQNSEQEKRKKPAKTGSGHTMPYRQPIASISCSLGDLSFSDASTGLGSAATSLPLGASPGRSASVNIVTSIFDVMQDMGRKVLRAFGVYTHIHVYGYTHKLETERERTAKRGFYHKALLRYLSMEIKDRSTQ